ncbi:MAG: hypothetical protein A3E01_04470 [Gammaproteobacteria bacterium RIFCSPHIGHO2_12_FULL_63_22]|nr:MAG: hypothetical protein A3E01_04470 [Gammaproteobacteria bacterium RIFCSPHIGHO2_12_FULL_63_22]
MIVLIRMGLATLVACAAAAGVNAQSVTANQLDRQIMNTESFLNAHPDLRFRLLGLTAYQAADYAKAMIHFKRAARYADKPSQGMIAEMHWNGQGVPVNKPLGYAWMDLAAERHFKTMLVNRERLWNALTEAEREQAVIVGQPVYAEFGDKVAKPRLERLLRNARSNSVGSRTGFVGAVTITIPGPSGDLTLDGSQYFQEKFWKPEAYWAWQAEDWKELPKGQVNVGPLKVPATE